MTAKRDFMNYLQFLQESGYLYVEGASAEELFRISAVTAKAPKKPALKAEIVKPRVDKSAAEKGGHNDLFGGATVALRKPVAPPLTEKPAAKMDEKLGGEDLPREERIQRLKALTAQAEACRECSLGKLRNKLVFSDGEPDAAIAIVGEAPGGEEDEQGIPFVGRSGQLLNKMLAAIGFKREEVYICNTLKCRPPENRDPMPAEKAACEHFLVAQLEIVRPKLLVALGAHAAQYLCRSDLGIGKLRGKWHSYHGIPLLATYHPAFLLRSPGFKGESWIDFQKIHKQYSESAPGDAREIWRKPE